MRIQRSSALIWETLCCQGEPSLNNCSWWARIKFSFCVFPSLSASFLFSLGESFRCLLWLAKWWWLNLHTAAMPDPLQDPVTIEKSKRNSVSHPDTLPLSHETPLQKRFRFRKRILKCWTHFNTCLSLCQ